MVRKLTITGISYDNDDPETFPCLPLSISIEIVPENRPGKTPRLNGKLVLRKHGTLISKDAWYGYASWECIMDLMRFHLDKVSNALANEYFGKD